MFTEKQIAYYKYLFENIFSEIADNSKEFRSFVEGNPNPLRIRLEELAIEMDREVMRQFDLANNSIVISRLLDKMSLVTELDAIVTEYIENNYV